MILPELNEAHDGGFFAAPALWLPQSSPWSLAALTAVADGLKLGQCRVRIYDADVAGGYPLARAAGLASSRGAWSILASATRLPWWEVPLAAVARGEHAVLWVGQENQPPEGGWMALASRAYQREVTVHWLPGDRALGMPRSNDEAAPSHYLPDHPIRWLGLRFWNRRLPQTMLADWKAGMPPRIQVAQGHPFWRAQALAGRATRSFAEEIGTALLDV